MIDIRPVSDLRNKFAEIEETVQNGQPIYLTKNGYGTMVVMSLETYGALLDNVEVALLQADAEAATNPKRMEHDEVFQTLRRQLLERE